MRYATERRRPAHYKASICNAAYVSYVLHSLGTYVRGVYSPVFRLGARSRLSASLSPAVCVRASRSRPFSPFVVVDVPVVVVVVVVALVHARRNSTETFEFFFCFCFFFLFIYTFFFSISTFATPSSVKFEKRRDAELINLACAVRLIRDFFLNFRVLGKNAEITRRSRRFYAVWPVKRPKIEVSAPGGASSYYSQPPRAKKNRAYRVVFFGRVFFFAARCFSFLVESDVQFAM